MDIQISNAPPDCGPISWRANRFPFQDRGLLFLWIQACARRSPFKVSLHLSPRSHLLPSFFLFSSIIARLDQLCPRRGAGAPFHVALILRKRAILYEAASRGTFRIPPQRWSPPIRKEESPPMYLFLFSWVRLEW